MRNMANSYSESNSQEQEPRTPDRKNIIYSPPKLRKIDRKVKDSREILLGKYLNTKILNESLEKELIKIKNENEEKELIIKEQNEVLVSNKNRLCKIQEILFENSESMPDFIYLKLMNSLVRKNL
tara:strand:+ start:2720 stop:3094 length:375 start_codon:yes stop_codon:yes gene_type:complete